MTDELAAQNCAEFQAHLPELIGSGQPMSLHPHYQSCENCRALLADLETIAEAARQLFPVEDPPDELWQQIEQAIQNEKSTAEPAEELPRRIVLTGFMGSGKSTVGPLLAARLGWRFVDADAVVEAEAGVSIAEIFRRDGEASFRALEQATILRLAAEDALVLALGGGAIESADTRTLLTTTPGILLIHLEVELPTALKRCRGTENLRPILADQANLASRYQRRLPLYRKAHVSISVDALSPQQATDAVLQAARLK